MWSSTQIKNKVNNNIAVSGAKYSLCALMSTFTTPMSSLSWLLSSLFNSDVNRSVQFIWPETNLDMYAV